MTRSTMGLAALVCAALLGACEDDEPEIDPAWQGVVESASRTEETVEEPETEVTEPEVAEAATGGELPMAADVLPSGEVSQGSRAVLADEYRFQVPDGFAAAEVNVEGAESVYAGDVDGMIRPTQLTLFVTQEPFDGDTRDYASQQKEALGAVEGNEVRPIPGAFMQAAGQGAQGNRWRVENDELIEMQQVYVHEGTAYTLHCRMPAQPMGWSNVGSDCMIRGATFHIAPPSE